MEYKLKGREDLLVSQLCREIDHLQESVEYWRNKYEEEKKLYDNMLSQNLADAQKGLGQALMFALSVKDSENGDLVIPAENRELFAKSL